MNLGDDNAKVGASCVSTTRASRTTASDNLKSVSPGALLSWNVAEIAVAVVVVVVTKILHDKLGETTVVIVSNEFEWSWNEKGETQIKREKNNNNK